MSWDMTFDGQVLTWRGFTYPATTGLPGSQLPREQCTRDSGPIPEGRYAFRLVVSGQAQDDGTGRCNLAAGWGLQTIPRGAVAGRCEPYWANWGSNRVRLEPADFSTRNACAPARGGFYLHDSTKGYSHGCIEVDSRFFDRLKSEARAHPGQRLILQVRYVPNRVTNGGTRVP
jgi:hypothetical protein